MQVIILSAGRGERLRPLTDRIPKPLLPAGDETVLTRHLRQLRECGLCDIVINVAHLGGQIKDAIKDGSQFGVRVCYSEESPALETAGGIRRAIARGLLPDAEPFLSVNADIICDINFAQIEIPTGSQCHLILVPNPPVHPQGDFSLSASGHLLNPKEGSGNSTFTYSGVGVYRPQMFADIQDGEAKKLYPLLQSAIHAQTATGQTHEGLWHDIGTPETLQVAQTHLAQLKNAS